MDRLSCRSQANKSEYASEDSKKVRVSPSLMRVDGFSNARVGSMGTRLRTGPVRGVEVVAMINGAPVQL